MPKPTERSQGLLPRVESLHADTTPISRYSRCQAARKRDAGTTVHVRDAAFADGGSDLLVLGVVGDVHGLRGALTERQAGLHVMRVAGRVHLQRRGPRGAAVIRAHEHDVRMSGRVPFAGALAAQTDIGARAAPCRGLPSFARASLTTMRMPRRFPGTAQATSRLKISNRPAAAMLAVRLRRSRGALVEERAGVSSCPGLASSPRKVRVLRASEAELHLQANEPWRDKTHRLEPRVLVGRRRGVVQRERAVVRGDCIGVEDVVDVHADGEASA